MLLGQLNGFPVSALGTLYFPLLTSLLISSYEALESRYCALSIFEVYTIKHTPFIPKALNMFGNWINDEHFSLALKILFLYSANERKMLNWLSQGQLRGSKHLAQIRIIRNLSTPSHFFPLKHISLKWRAAFTSALICIQPRLRYQGHWQPETHFCHLQLVFTGNSESL